MGAAAAFLYFAANAARHMVARQQLGRPASRLVALRVTPAFLLVVRRLAAVVGGDIVEHKAASLIIPENASFAANAFRHQDAAHAGRPNHARGMELDELHVDQGRSRPVGERVTVAGAFPTVAGDGIGSSQAAGRQHDGLGLKDLEAPAFALITEGAHHAAIVLQQGNHGAFGMKRNALVDAVVLQGANHFEAGAVAHVRQTRIAMPAKVALENAAIGRAVEQGPPGF